MITIPYKKPSNTLKLLAQKMIELDIKKQNISQKKRFFLNKIVPTSYSPLKTILSNFDGYNHNEKFIIEMLISLHIDSCVDELNTNNHASMLCIFSFAKSHNIDFKENVILNFYFDNLVILTDEKEKLSLNFFFQILSDNLILIDEDKLYLLFTFFDEQTFDNKNELIFIISNLYLVKKCIFSEKQIENLLEQIYIFCTYSQYQLLDVAINIIEENFENVSIMQITKSFIYDLNLQYDSLDIDSKYLNHFFQYINNL